MIGSILLLLHPEHAVHVRAAFLFLSIRYFISGNLVPVRPVSIPCFVCFLKAPFVWAVWIPCCYRRWNSLYLKFMKYWTSNLWKLNIKFVEYWTSNLWSSEPQICRILNLKFVEYWPQICGVLNLKFVFMITKLSAPLATQNALYLSSKGLCSVRQNWPSLSAYGALLVRVLGTLFACLMCLVLFVPVTH